MRRSTCSTFLVAAAFCLACIAPLAQAAVVTYDFTAKVSYLLYFGPGYFYVNPIASSDMPGSLVSVGDTASGQLSFDTALMTSVYSPSTSLSVYSLPGLAAAPSTAIHYTIASSGAVFSATQAPNIAIMNTPHEDFYAFTAAMDAPTGQSGHLSFTLDDPSARAINSTALPGDLPLSRFPHLGLQSNFSRDAEGDRLAVMMTITSITPNQVSLVPEPSAYDMLLAGLGLFGAVARRRRQC